MAAEPQYLTGDPHSIGQFVDRFDVCFCTVDRSSPAPRLTTNLDYLNQLTSDRSFFSIVMVCLISSFNYVP